MKLDIVLFKPDGSVGEVPLNGERVNQAEDFNNRRFAIWAGGWGGVNFDCFREDVVQLAVRFSIFYKVNGMLRIGKALMIRVEEHKSLGPSESDSRMVSVLGFFPFYRADRVLGVILEVVVLFFTDC